MFRSVNRKYLIILFLIVFMLFVNKFLFLSQKLYDLSVSTSERTYIHSAQQLELTKIVKIQPKVCNNIEPISVFIHSAAKYLERRQTLRSTWVNDVKLNNISVYFALGATYNASIQKMIEIEAQKYGDLIQFDFIDNYYNNTLKGISILRWINKFCSNSEFILKTDDDVVVDINEILRNLHRFESGISGSLFIGAGVDRWQFRKWHMPIQYYPQPTYPAYLNGPAYIMTTGISDRLLQTIERYSGFILDIDDMFITGIIAESAGILRHPSDYIHAYSCSDVCVMYFTAITYDCKTSEELTNFYIEWKSNRITAEYCQRKQTIRLFLFLTAVTLFSIGLSICVNLFPKRITKYKHNCLTNSNSKQLI